MQWIERLMYAVDEWLRFKSRQTRLTMVLKGALGTLWFFVAYAIRFCVNLLIEPQLNPVKHVPWVTVSHKVLAPMWIAMDLRGLLAQHMNAAMADLMTFLIVTLTPGIFGYLVWELKENWRLFAANRSATLDPVLVGSHGESLPRLLRPGLHSGTIPKRFAKLRRAERKAIAVGSDPRAVRKHREALHHVEISVRRYIEREFNAWFSESRRWPLPLPHVEEIHLATNSIIIEVAISGAVEGPLAMAFELIEGRPHLCLAGAVCGQTLSDSARKVLHTAIINVLKTGGVEVLDGWSQRTTIPCDGSQPLEIGTWVMPWSEWVAMWDSNGDASEPAPWGRLNFI